MDNLPLIFKIILFCFEYPILPTIVISILLTILFMYIDLKDVYKVKGKKENA